VPDQTRRGLVFFGACVVVSMVLEGLHVAGVHSVALRIAATFSFALGLAVLLIKGSQAQRAEQAERDR
jgi:hypothetical protein